MEVRGSLKEITKDWRSEKFRLTFEVDNVTEQEIDDISNKDLRITVKQWKERRSLDANAYCWVLVSKIAERLVSTKEEIYEIMLKRYGVMDTIDGSPVCVTIKNYIDISLLGGHWLKLKENGTFASYMRIKGSSEYDTLEMSRFIDGIISECKELGIETMTPAELERIMQAWGKRNFTAS